MEGHEIETDDLPEEVQKQLDALIGCWRFWDDPNNENFYLTVLAPRIVAGNLPADLNENERMVIDQLRSVLSPGQWAELPKLIAARRRWQALAPEREIEEARLADLREAEAVRLEDLRRQAESACRRRKGQLLARIQRLLNSDFLGVDEILRSDPDFGLLDPGELEELKGHFVRSWAATNLEQELDSDQAAAVAAIGGDLQIVARAGSGKTRTLVTRAIFLQQHCGVSPSELVLLAFNRKAAKEMAGRLKDVLGGENTPHVMTFHALAYALVHPEEELIYDDPNAGQLGLSREVLLVIDQHIRSEEYRPMVRDLMLAHYRDDWERIVNGRFELSVDEFLAHRRSLPRESLNGTYVKSFGERVIANALCENGIEYRYERGRYWNGTIYKPDFTIGQDRGVVIEYFGLAGDADYDSQSQAKREYWSKEEGWTLIERSPDELRSNGVERFVEQLLQQLNQAGVESRALSEEEIWSLVSQRAVDRFTTAMSTFVGRCRSQDLDPVSIRAAIREHSPSSTSEAMFLDIGASVFESYLRLLDTEGKEDFNGLVWRAIERLRSGETRFSRGGGNERGDLRRTEHVLVDEFQDFSPMFFAILSAVRQEAPKARFFCVGDDWQAINGFAGSDLRFFEDFSSYFEQTSSLTIETNYRSPTSIVNAGNALMYGRGRPGVANRDDTGSAQVARLESFNASASEEALHGRDEITPAVLRLIRASLDRGQDVVLLSRLNRIRWRVNYGNSAAKVPNQLDRFLDHLRSFLPEEDRGRLGIFTTHKFKGLEQSAVIVLDAVDDNYPLIHPAWAWYRVFGDTLERLQDEERRLFYVAITRAHESLTLITEKGTESPFIGEIGCHLDFESTRWDDLPPVPSLDGERLEIRISNAYDIRDQLKDLNYRWIKDGSFWRRSVPADGFSFDHLISQPWKRGAVKVDVLTEDGNLKHSA